MLSPHDVVSRCFALSLLAAAELEGGDRAAAEIALDELLELADLNDIEALSLNAMTTRCWHAALTGNLPGAARLAAEALAMATHDPTATTGITLQLAYIAWQRGQFAELLPYLEQLDPTMVGDVAKRLLTARALAAAGDHRRAVSIIDTITRTDLEGLSKDLLWSTTLIFAAETAFMLDSKALGAEVFRLLAPFRSRVAVANFVVAPIAYGAGLAAAAARGDDVDSLFDEALDITERLDAPVLRARTEIAWTIVRHARGTTTDGARHAALVDDARAICNELELTQLCVSGDPSTWRLR
jgi:hypothetical protein